MATTERRAKRTKAKGKGKNKGHGRNGAKDYPGAEHVAVSHPELKASGPCPKGRLQWWPRQLEKRVLKVDVIRTDATGVKVLDPQSPENIERGTMWCYMGDDRDVVFRYAPTGEGATGPWEFLAGRTGYVQADAASVFDRVFNGTVASAEEVGAGRMHDEGWLPSKTWTAASPTRSS